MLRRRRRETDDLPQERPAPALIELGSIECPSGELVLVDAGYLGMWSGSGSPADVELDIPDPETAQGFAAASDFEIAGPDAAAAASVLGRQPGRSIYDIPAYGIDELRTTFDGVRREQGLDAELVDLGRVPHRERVHRAALDGGGEFLVMGVSVVAAPVRSGQPLRVDGARVDFGGRVGEQWAVIAVTVSNDEVAMTRELGGVGVDHARVLLADAEALSSWQHDLPLDGLADVAFWGADALQAQRALGGSTFHRDEHVHGWENLELQDAIAQAQALDEWRAANAGVRLATDLRPHSHHWLAMTAAKTSEHGVGFLDLNSTQAALALTGWGDGYFPVLGDFTDDGRLVSVRLVLGDSDRATRMEELYDRWERDQGR